MNEDSAHKEALFVCGFFLWVFQKKGVIYGRNQEAPPIPFQSTAEANLRSFGRLLPEEGGRMPSSRIVISSESEKSFSFAVKQQL